MTRDMEMLDIISAMVALVDGDEWITREAGERLLAGWDASDVTAHTWHTEGTSPGWGCDFEVLTITGSLPGGIAVTLRAASENHGVGRYSFSGESALGSWLGVRLTMPDEPARDALLKDIEDDLPFARHPRWQRLNGTDNHVVVTWDGPAITISHADNFV